VDEDGGREDGQLADEDGAQEDGQRAGGGEPLEDEDDGHQDEDQPGAPHQNLDLEN
jgi:hypothetical protein